MIENIKDILERCEAKWPTTKILPQSPPVSKHFIRLDPTTGYLVLVILHNEQHWATFYFDDDADFARGDDLICEMAEEIEKAVNARLASTEVKTDALPPTNDDTPSPRAA